jgi:hypothetical protein
VGYIQVNMLAVAEEQTNVLLFLTMSCLALELFDEEEEDIMLWITLLLCISHNRQLQIQRSYVPARRMNFDNLPRPAKELFRFSVEQLRILCCALNLPEVWITKNGLRTSSLEALAILCRRLSYPNRWCDLVTLFGRSEGDLCHIFMEILDYLYKRFNDPLLRGIDWNRVGTSLQSFGLAIACKGAPLSSVFGFIDGTTRAICRPTSFQRSCYSGHKRYHALKFQSIVSPDGIILHLFGPIEGRRHDCFLLRESKLDSVFADPRSVGYHIYGDPAYPIRGYMLSGYKGSNLSEAQKLFNSQMSKVRESVEWGFKIIITNWAFLDFEKNLKVFLSPVAKMYSVAGLLTNFLTCLQRGNQISDYFELRAPTIYEYIGNH